jgi:hypothetical protein
MKPFLEKKIFLSLHELANDGGPSHCKNERTIVALKVGMNWK